MKEIVLLISTGVWVLGYILGLGDGDVISQTIEFSMMTLSAISYAFCMSESEKSFITFENRREDRVIQERDPRDFREESQKIRLKEISQAMNLNVNQNMDKENK